MLQPLAMNPTTPDDPLIGQLFAERFRIERRLGAGGMGAVYLARQIAMDRLVALKVLHPGLAGTDQAARRFHREMQATARVEHQNTIRVHDFGESDGRLFLAMELLDGRTLTQALRQSGPMPAQRVIHIGVQIARALGAAHLEGVIHRDLKPDNVMLLDRYGERDFVKVLDFGIARLADDQDPTTQLTEAGSLVGTPVYMSPEQSMGRAVDARSDLYALGIVLYHLVTGAVPFQDPTPLRVLFMHVQDTPRPPSELVRGVSPPLEALILRLLAKDPLQRPQTAAEVADCLGQCSDATLDAGRAPTVQAVPVDGDTLAADLAVVEAPTIAAPGPIRRVELPPVTEAQTRPTVSEPARKSLRWLAILSVVLLAVAALAWLLMPRTPPHIAQHAALQATAPAQVDRSLLDAAYARHGDPLPPPECRCAECGEQLAVLARSQLAAGQADLALASAQSALRKCPKFALAEHLAGKAHTLLGKNAEAQAAFERAVQIAPDYTAPVFNLGLLAVARKDGPEALRRFQPLQAREPTRADVWFGLGHALALTGETVQARAAWCKASELCMAEAKALCQSAKP